MRWPCLLLDAGVTAVPRWQKAPGSRTGQRGRPPSILFVAANRTGEASQRITAKRGGVNCDAREVDEDTPEVTALSEARLNRCNITISFQYVGGDAMEVVNEGQVDLGVPEVGRHICHHRAGVGGDEVVLLGIAVEQRR